MRPSEWDLDETLVEGVAQRDSRPIPNLRSQLPVAITNATGNGHPCVPLQAREWVGSNRCITRNRIRSTSDFILMRSGGDDSLRVVASHSSITLSMLPRKALKRLHLQLHKGPFAKHRRLAWDTSAVRAFSVNLTGLWLAKMKNTCLSGVLIPADRSLSQVWGGRA